MNKSEQASQEARALFQSRCDGVLSTHSIDLPGYPFGSITPYCINLDGQPVILISTIAQHTKNILADNKVSLIAYDPQTDDAQAAGRVTYIANAIKTDDEAMAERYYRFHPNSRNFHNTHNFNFYTLDFVRVRYIGGFGEIYWVEKAGFMKESPFSFEEETGMVEHMNEDHQDAMNHYCELFSIAYDAENLPKIVGVDGEGFHLRVAGQLHRLQFAQAVKSTMEARQALVELARRAI
ncbi:MAG: putative heme iron utilization protein [Methylophagaceae bacterium]|jgi:putative heme iron utilization protein